MKLRAIGLALLLAATPAAMAQTMPVPRADIAELRKEALADPAIKAALQGESRSIEMRLKDDARNVEIILKASKAKAGDRVLDVGSIGGYLAILFSNLVGPKGHVDIHNTPSWIAQFPWVAEDKQRKVIKNPNVGWLALSWNDLDAPADSYDVVVMGRVYHDVLVESGDYELLNSRVFKMLKPGGRVLIEDHDADPAMRADQQASLHRISHANVAKQLMEAGFAYTDLIVFESKSDNQKTDVFRPGVRGRTDHFIAVFQKPLDGKPLR